MKGKNLVYVAAAPAKLETIKSKLKITVSLAAAFV